MAKIFISYSRKDIEFAKRLTAELTKSELDFWIDWEGIPPTVDWWKEIEKGIEEADVFLFLISPDSAKSKICGQEIDTAVKNGKRVIPIVIREINWEDTPPQLGHLNYIFFSRDDDFDTAVKKLLTAIHTDYEWAANHRRLQVKALEWERNHKENSFLLRGKDLQDAEFQLAINTSKDPFPTDLQREYVFTSRRATDKQRRITTSISIAGILALAALATFGFIQAGLARTAQATAESNAATAQAASTLAISNEQEAKRQAQVALARQLAAQAQSINVSFAGNEYIAQMLAVQSMKLFPTADAASLLINGHSAPVIYMTHEDGVEAVAFSPDGKYVVSASHDKTARVWEASSGQEIARMSHDDWVLSVAFSPNGKYVVSGSRDKTARVWDASSGKEISRTTYDNSVVSVAFSPDGKYVVAGSFDGTARVWYAFNGKEITRMTHSDQVNIVAFSPDGKYVVSGSKDATVRVWDSSNGNEIARMTDEGTVEALDISPDGKYVVSGDNVLHIWEIHSGKEITRMHHEDQVLSVTFSPDGKYVASGSLDNTERIWDAPNGNEIIQIPDNFWVNTVKFSPNGKNVISAGWDGVAHVWEAASGKEIIRMNHDGEVRSAVFSPNGKYVVSASEDGTVRVWEWQAEDLIAYGCGRNLTYAEWQKYIGDALPYQPICEDLPLEPEVIVTP